MDKKFEKKIEKLQKILEKCGKTIVAYSGGIDSTFLAYQAHKILGRENVIAVTLDFEMMPDDDLDTAIRIAKKFKFNHIVIEKHASKKILKNNPPDRCYLCKKDNFAFLKKYCRETGYDTVLDGSNFDDDPKKRPGHKAVVELGILTPLREAGLTKNEIRQAAKEAGIDIWDKPSSPCLATRFPHHHPVLPDEMEKIGKAEKYIRGLGFPVVRVRYHNNIARIELPKEKIAEFAESGLTDKVSKKLLTLGFDYVTLDLNGYQG